MTIKRYGWRRGLPEATKFMYYPPMGLMAAPAMVDLQAECPAIFDQGDLGSCTAQAAAGLGQFVMKKTGHKWFVPSRLAIYYWTRLFDGTANSDSGASLSDTMKTLTGKGLPHESLWWYNVSKFRVKPNKLVVADAHKHLAGQALSITQDLAHMKACLAEGFPFIFGFTVYESFESDAFAKNGIMPMPKPNEGILGGHAVMAVGYDDAKQMFKMRNSWGTGWGLKGYFYMPYSFITNMNYADDFWTFKAFSTWA